jgi:hypothetical protein
MPKAGFQRAIAERSLCKWKALESTFQRNDHVERSVSRQAHHNIRSVYLQVP